MPNQIVDFNLPNAYQAEMDKIAYQQRLAEMLQKQSEDPIGEYSYKGIQARIPATAGLAKVLQAFGAAYNQKKAEEQKTALQNQQLEDYRNDYAMAREARMGVAGTDAVPSSGMIPAVAGSPEVRVGDETVMGMAPSSAAQQYKPAVQATPEREPYGMAPSTFAKDAVAAVAPNPQEYERILQESKNPLLNERGLFAQESRLEREQAARSKKAENIRLGPNETIILPDGTVLRGETPATGFVAEYDRYVQDERAAGRVPKTLEQLKKELAIAGRTPAQQRERYVLDPVSGMVINLDTQEAIPVNVNGKQQPSRNENAPLRLINTVSPREREKLLIEQPQQTLAATTALQKLDLLSNVAKELKTHPGLPKITGRANQYAIFDVSGEAVDARALQSTLIKQSAVQALQAMKESSKNGGAVGSVTETEWPILEQQLAALNAAQTTPAYQTALENLINQMASSMERVKKAYVQTYGNLDYTPAPYVNQANSKQAQTEPPPGAVRRVKSRRSQ